MSDVRRPSDFDHDTIARDHPELWARLNEAISDTLNALRFESVDDADRFFGDRWRVAALGDMTCRSCRVKPSTRRMSWPVSADEWDEGGGSSIRYVCGDCGRPYVVGYFAYDAGWWVS